MTNGLCLFLSPALSEAGAAACQSGKSRVICINLLAYPKLKIIQHTTHPDKAV